MTLELKAKKRELPTLEINQARQKNLIPIELYGHGQENQHLWVETAVLEKVYQQAGESSLIDLAVEGTQPVKVIIRELQFHPVNGKITHVDLQQVRMDEKLETNLALIFEGESKAIKELGGTLIKGLEELNIKCLPADLIHNYVINIDSLDTFDDLIRVKDLKISDKIEILDDPETVVVSVAPVYVEKEAPAPAAAEEAIEPELVGKEKKEGEEGTEVEQAGKKEAAVKKESSKKEKE